MCLKKCDYLMVWPKTSVNWPESYHTANGYFELTRISKRKLYLIGFSKRDIQLTCVER